MTSMDEGVEQWIRANVFSLVSALGGPGVEDGRYRLGHEALSVFKDLKRWTKAWDLDKNRLDVARACADANLVKGDLLEILAAWSGDEHDNRLLTKASLYSTDLLTILTWPPQKDEQTATTQSLIHGPFLATAQASYKRAILHHDHSKILRQTVRVCLPALAIPRNEREGWDDNIIKVVLYLYRNLVAITQPEGLRISEGDTDISRHVTIDAFHHQDVFPLLLTVGSGIGDEFDGHDTELLEVLFQICKGIDADTLFMEGDELVSSNTRELQALIGKEKSMLAGYAKSAPSRHNRFGTMMWLKRDDGRMSTLLGQTSSNEQATLQEMDKSKKWRKPRRPNRSAIENPLHEFNTTVALTGSSRRHLRSFVEQFLDSSFNPLFLSLRRSIESELPRVLAEHRRLYFFLIAWLLRAERARRRKRRTDATQSQSHAHEETESFALVAAVLNHETFVLLNRSMQSALDLKEWQNLSACMRCFTEILHTVQEMLDSSLEEDQEIAENTLNRIFYEQTTHDRITTLLRTYKDQGFGYLDACTDLAHTFIRLLERYSKQNVDMQVRSIRRARKKKKAQAAAIGENTDMPDDRAMEVEDVAEAQKTSTERGFDFKKFAARFVNQASIETFAQLLKFYKELTTDQLRRAHRFLYRAAFKMDMSIYIMRLDLIQLLHKMVKGPEPMNRDDPTFKEWEELSKQIFRKLIRRMEERPALAVEVLFSKIPSTCYYLEHGQEREIAKKATRLPAELEVKPGMDKEQQIGVAVAILVNQAKSDLLAWVKKVLDSAAEERASWEAEAEARTILEGAETGQQETAGEEMPQNQNHDLTSETPEPLTKPTGDGAQDKERPKPSPILVRGDTDGHRQAMAKDKYLRLLLTLIGFDKLDITDSDIDRDGILTSWTIPGAISSVDLTRSSKLISGFEFSPPSFEEGKSAEDLVRRKANPSAGGEAQSTVARRSGAREGVDSDSEGGSIASGLEESLFPAGGPTPRAPDGFRKKIQRRRNHHEHDSLIPDEVLEARREARRKLEREKAAKIKSQLYISPSDDESDDDRDRAFFEREAYLRSNVGRAVAQAEAEAARGAVTKTTSKKGKSKAQASKKRKAMQTSDAEEDELSDDMPAPKKRAAVARRSGAASSSTSSSADSDADTDTDMGLPSTLRRRAAAKSAGAEDTAESEADTDTPPSSEQPPSDPHHLKEPASRSLSAEKEDVEMSDDDGDSDKENAGAKGIGEKIAPAGRLSRRAVVIESDSDE